MQHWADELKKSAKVLRTGIVAANNHYAGFGLSTANIFRRLLGMPELQFREEEKGQSKLTDF